MQPDPAQPSSQLPHLLCLLRVFCCELGIKQNPKIPLKVFPVVLRGQEQPGTAAGSSSLSSFSGPGMLSSGCRGEIPNPGNANQTGARGQHRNLPNPTPKEALCSPYHLLRLSRISLIVTEPQNGFSWKGH